MTKKIAEAVLTALILGAIGTAFQMWRDVERLKIERQAILDNYREYIEEQLQTCPPEDVGARD